MYCICLSARTFIMEDLEDIPERSIKFVARNPRERVEILLALGKKKNELQYDDKESATYGEGQSTS